MAHVAPVKNEGAMLVHCAFFHRENGMAESKSAGDSSKAGASSQAAGAGETKNVGLNVRLTPVGNTDQPIYSNFTNVTVSPGTVFVDFGFLEPAVLAALPQMVRDGSKLPDSLNGRLSARIAMGLDAMANLHQQLTRVMQSLNAAAEAQKAQK
jgi:hypothetical protein